ncbi:hypothetical protein GW17_00046861 [Ensete ventricosum]|nr:hypothetical protein GW17_00046861 [Ensete ventricosum]
MDLGELRGMPRVAGRRAPPSRPTAREAGASPAREAPKAPSKRPAPPPRLNGPTLRENHSRRQRCCRGSTSPRSAKKTQQKRCGIIWKPMKQILDYSYRVDMDCQLRFNHTPHNKNVAKRALISRLLRIARSPVRQPKSIIVFLCLLGTGTLHFIFSEGIAAMSSSWSRALTQISPYTFASIGIAISIGVSVLGAAWWDDRNLCFLPCFSS